MALKTLQPNTMLLFIDTSGGVADYDLVVCLTSLTMNGSTNVIDANSFCGTDKLAGVVDGGEISFEGQIMLAIGTEASTVYYKRLYDAWAAKSVLSWKIAPVTPVAGDLTFTGSGFLSSNDLTFSNDELPTFSNTITNKTVPVCTVTA